MKEPPNKSVQRMTLVPKNKDRYCQAILKTTKEVKSSAAPKIRRPEETPGFLNDGSPPFIGPDKDHAPHGNTHTNDPLSG